MPKQYEKTLIKSDNVKEYNKLYFENILKPRIKNNKIHCDICNTNYTEWNKVKHPLSMKHKKLMNLSII